MSQTQIGGSISEPGDPDMETNDWKETFVERKVTYTIEVDGKFIIIENVPARVCLETGERLFSPETVERLQPPPYE
jgi:YgiT-type zinc finger domain-containing protein